MDPVVLEEDHGRPQHGEALREEAVRIVLPGGVDVGHLVGRLGQRGEGEVYLVLQIEDGRREVEVKLPGRYLVTPQIAGAIKAISGVAAVQQA